ncbi:hypothetical protein [Nisaea sp.]|uniref:AtuA-related protein n=1 Tax=Nisaea sp. TaxID=2024842 RepID=UPI0032984208
MTVVLDTLRLRLHDIAHGRSGDKGNRSNISVIPYTEAAYSLVLEQVTEERVLSLFGHKGASAVTRYELPNLPALNFVIDDALEGGVNSTLNLDLHGKTLSFMLLDLPIEVPMDRVHEFTQGRRKN